MEKVYAMAGNRTRVNCLEGNYANHYTTIAPGKFENSNNKLNFLQVPIIRKTMQKNK